MAKVTIKRNKPKARTAESLSIGTIFQYLSNDTEESSACVLLANSYHGDEEFLTVLRLPSGTLQRGYRRGEVEVLEIEEITLRVV